MLCSPMTCLGINARVATSVVAVCILLTGCASKPAAPIGATPKSSSPAQLRPFEDVSKIRDAYKKTKALTDEQRQRLEDASLSPHIVSALAFLVLIICNEDGNFPSARLQELFGAKATAVDPEGMRLHVKTYRIWAKAPVWGGDLLVDASGVWKVGLILE